MIQGKRLSRGPAPLLSLSIYRLQAGRQSGREGRDDMRRREAEVGQQEEKEVVKIKVKHR